MVLAGGVQAFEQFDCRGPRVGFLRGTFPELYQRIGLFRPGRENAARAMILERPAYQALAVGKQGRGKRVAVISGHPAAVPAE